MAGLIALWGLSKMVGCGEETPPVEVAPPVEEEPFAGEQAVPCPPEDRWPTGMVCVQGGVLPGCEAEGPGSEPIWVDSVFIDADPVGTGAWEACLGSCACSEQEAPVQSVCEALGKRLSTETEWRAAQLGPLGGLEPGELCAPSEPGRGLDEPGSRCAVSLDGAEGIGTRFVAALEEEHFGADSWYALDPEFRTWRTRQLGIEDVGASYKDPDMAEGLLRAYHAAFPEITRLHELGTSWQGRPILALQVSDFGIPERDKPAVLLNGAHHGHELLSVEYTFDALDQILRGYRLKDERVLGWVQGLDIWVIPVVNPDGLQLTMYLHHGFWKEDLGGRKNGRDFPAACALTEERRGVDLNRNYPYGWGEPGSSGEVPHRTYRGESPGSEPETQVVMELAQRHHFLASLTYHTAYPAVITPYTVGGRKNPEPDLARHVAGLIAPEGFPVLANLYPVAGTDQDWLFHSFGTLAFIIEGDAHNPVAPAKRAASVERVSPVVGTLLDLLLEGPRLYGWVQDAEGNPVEAVVRVAELKSFEDEAWSTRADGRFDRLVIDEGVYTVTAESPDGRKASATIDLAEPGTLPLTLVLR